MDHPRIPKTSPTPWCPKDDTIYRVYALLVYGDGCHPCAMAGDEEQDRPELENWRVTPEKPTSTSSMGMPRAVFPSGTNGLVSPSLSLKGGIKCASVRRQRGARVRMAGGLFPTLL